MEKLELRSYTLFVVRSIYCETCKRMEDHTVYFVRLEAGGKNVLYFKTCERCRNHAYQMQKDYHEQVLDIEFKSDDFRYNVTIEQALVEDWKALWKGDYM